MTNFIDRTKKEVKKETVFTHYVKSMSEVIETNEKPMIYKNVEFLFTDEYYGDVFRCWENDEKYSTLYFGTKGDEF